MTKSSLLLLGLLVIGCEDDESIRPNLGPVYSTGTGSDANETELPPSGESTDAGAEADRPLSPRSRLCPPVVPRDAGASKDSVHAIALTDSQFFVSHASGIEAYARHGACPSGAGRELGGVVSRGVAVQALAAAVGDAVLVGSSEGLRLIGPAGERLADCDPRVVTSVSSMVDGGQGSAVAVVEGQKLLSVSFGAGWCTAFEMALVTPALAILGAALDPRATGEPSAILGVLPESVSAPALTWRDGPGWRGVCSIAALTTAGSTVAVLDPTCGKLHFVDPSSAAGRFLLAIPEGRIGRAVAPVPGTRGSEVALATEDDQQGHRSIWSVSTTLP